MKMKDIKKKPSPNVSKDSASPASKPPGIKFVEEAKLDNNTPVQNIDVIEESKVELTQQIDTGRTLKTEEEEQEVANDFDMMRRIDDSALSAQVRTIEDCELSAQLRTIDDSDLSAQIRVINDSELNLQLAQAQQQKKLSFEKIAALELSDRFAIENLRSLYMLDCSLSDISNNSAMRVYKAAGRSLKKVNLSKNSIITVPTQMFELCPSIVSLQLAKN